jgi:hypothetical protein
MGNFLDVKLTNQSFRDAGGREVFPDLEIDAPLRVVTNGDDDEEIWEYANDRLRQEAQKKGDTCVFGINYELKRSSPLWDFECTAIGTGYKPKK